jgi:hypothetical protein
MARPASAQAVNPCHGVVAHAENERAFGKKLRAGGLAFRLAGVTHDSGAEVRAKTQAGPQIGFDLAVPE